MREATRGASKAALNSSARSNAPMSQAACERATSALIPKPSKAEGMKRLAWSQTKTIGARPPALYTRAAGLSKSARNGDTVGLAPPLAAKTPRSSDGSPLSCASIMMARIPVRALQRRAAGRSPPFLLDP